MTVPVPAQPNVESRLLNQTHIALNLFDTILKMETNRAKLEQSWIAIKQDITIQEQLEAIQRQRRNLPSFPSLKVYSSLFYTYHPLSDALTLYV